MSHPAGLIFLPKRTHVLLELGELLDLAVVSFGHVLGLGRVRLGQPSRFKLVRCLNKRNVLGSSMEVRDLSPVRRKGTPRLHTSS